MTSHLGTYVRRQRENLSLSRGDVARAMGRRNVSKACRRLLDLETQGKCDREFWRALRAVVSFEDAEITRAVQRDREEHERWLDEPVPMQVVIRWMAAVYSTVELPPGAADDPVKAKAFACEVARERHRKVCLVVSRRLRVWFDETGRGTARTGPETPGPFMQLKGRRFLLTIGQGG